MSIIANNAPTRNARRRLPPYGKILAHRIKEDRPPIELAIHDRLERFNINSQQSHPQFVRLCYPSGTPSDYDWSLVKGFECLVIRNRISPREAAELALELLLNDAKIVRVIAFNSLIVYGGAQND